ncbi:MAG TPA: GyrI-like domain-containing protein [Candidatus Dormibacteraeota bacterium]|nr:GyrI-like domain-containing protein [Candidatus Dormibacteraeota bacterium]
MATAVLTPIGQLMKPAVGRPEIVEVPELNFLMVDGRGAPEASDDFQAAIGALYPLAYGAKFALKRSGVETRVMPLEALWWTSSSGAFVPEELARWRWTAMIMQPDEVTVELIEKVRADAMRKKPNPTLAKVALKTFREGLCAQIMHVGPYTAEKPTIEKLHAFIAAEGYTLSGKHHEIYLGDPRRAAPEKLRTIVRQPIVRR